MHRDNVGMRPTPTQSAAPWHAGETPVLLSELGRAFPAKPLHPKTYLRWARAGVRGIRLRSFRLGKQILTTVEEAHRFAAKLTEVYDQ